MIGNYNKYLRPQRGGPCLWIILKSNIPLWGNVCTIQALPKGHATEWALHLFWFLSSQSLYLSPTPPSPSKSTYSVLRGKWNCTLCIMTAPCTAFNYTRGEWYHRFCKFPSPSAWARPRANPPPSCRVKSACAAFRWADIWTACQPHAQVCRGNRPPSNVLLGDNNLWENDVTQSGGWGGGGRQRAPRADKHNSLRPDRSRSTVGLIV